MLQLETKCGRNKKKKRLSVWGKKKKDKDKENKTVLILLLYVLIKDKMFQIYLVLVDKGYQTTLKDYQWAVSKFLDQI